LGSRKKEPIIKLEKLLDEQEVKWRYLLKVLKASNCFFTSFDNICVVKHYAYLNVLVANIIWDKLGLNAVFHNEDKRLISLAIITRIVAISLCIAPAFKSKISEWFCKTALPWFLDSNPNHNYSKSSVEQKTKS